MLIALGIGCAVCAICGGWLLMRGAASLPGRWRQRIAWSLVILALLFPVQMVSGYTLTPTYSSFVLGGISFGAVFLALFLYWHSTKGPLNRGHRMVAGALILSSLLCTIVGTPFFLLAMSLSLGLHGVEPLFEGRISPTRRYKIVLGHSLMGATPYYSYVVYENPPGLPFVQRAVASGPAECPYDERDQIAGEVSIAISPGSAPGVLNLSCRHEGREEPAQVITLAEANTRR